MANPSAPKETKKKRRAPARDEDHRAEFFATSPDPSALELIHLRAARLLSIPNSLAGASRVVTNLPPIIALARQLDLALVLQFDAIDAWIAAFSNVPADTNFARISILSKVNHGFRNGENYVSPPFEGIFQSNSAWTVLWHEAHPARDDPDGPDRKATYRQLQALFLCACIRASIGFADTDTPRRTYEAALLLRKLQQRDLVTELDHWKNPLAINDKWRFFAKRHFDAPRDLRQGYGAFADLLWRTNNLRFGTVFQVYLPSARLPSSKSSKRNGFIDFVFEDYFVSIRPLGRRRRMPGEPALAEVETEGPGKKATAKIIASGACPDEFSEVCGILVPVADLVDDETGVKGELPPIASLYAAARGRYRSEVMRAQSFITRRGRPRLKIIGQIMNTLALLSNESGKSSVEPVSSKSRLVCDTALLCAVCLLNGLTPSEAVRLKAFTEARSLPASWFLAYSPEYKVWLRPYLPPERNPLSDAARDNQRVVSPRIALSDVWGVGMALGPPKDGKWFGQPVSSYRDIFSSRIRPELELAGIPRDWCEFDGLAEILPAWFDGKEEGESLRNDAIFGRESSSSTVQRHYVALDRGLLDRYYSSNMKELWHLLELNGLVSPGTWLHLREPSQIPASVTGNDWAPKAGPVKDLLVILRQRILGKREPTLFEHHNLLTAYVAIGLAVSMAFRDVRTPITDLRLIDPETGFLPVQEKDRADGSHARIVWIPAVVRDAVDDYRAHLRGVWARLVDIDTCLVVKPTKARDKRMFGKNAFELSLLDTLFFFQKDNDENWRPVEFTGTQLMELLNTIHPGWPIPNAGRHLSATHAFNFLGASPNDSQVFFAVMVKALLGHWHLGEWAWTSNSGFDPYRFREAIMPVIEAILTEIDFKRIL